MDATKFTFHTYLSLSLSKKKKQKQKQKQNKKKNLLHFILGLPLAHYVYYTLKHTKHENIN